MVDTPHVQYEVTHIAVANEPDGKGGYEKTHTIHFRTPDGTESFVKVPHRNLHPHHVHTVIQHEVDAIGHIMSLGHGQPPAA